MSFCNWFYNKFGTPTQQNMIIIFIRTYYVKHMQAVEIYGTHAKGEKRVKLSAQLHVQCT